MHRSPFAETLKPIPLKLPLKLPLRLPLRLHQEMSQHTLHPRLQLLLQLLLQLPDHRQVSSDGLSTDWRKSIIESF